MYYQSYKYRIYPTKEQEVLLNKTFGCNRFIWNQMLNERIKVYEKYKEDTDSLYSYNYTTEKDYKGEYDWLKEIDSISLQQTRLDLKQSYTNFFRNLKKGQISFPKFKSRHRKNSYRTINVNGNIEVHPLRKRIKVPKLGWIKYRDDRVPLTKINSITLSKTKSGKFYVSILHQKKDFKELPITTNIVGLDIGIKNFLVTSDGEVFQNLNLKRINEKKLNKLHKDLSRKKKGSNNRQKSRIELSKLYEKLNNQKQDYLHKVTNSLINENQVIVIENLNVKGMLKNRNLSKSIQNLSIHKFIQMLKYKSEWNNKTVIQVDRYFPSSKLCSHCGTKNEDLTLKDREWTCKKCDTTHDRDHNASVNILHEGKRILNKDTAGTAEINACEVITQ